MNDRSLRNLRTLEKVITAMEVTEGAGVTVFRTIGTPPLRNLDPFLLLDHFGNDDPDQYIAGFPDHPHRGFITFTYMLNGRMQHRDSMGNEGNLQSGAAQWMKAASGVIHSEMPQQREGLMKGFQLWINLPASEKMSKPVYQEFSPQAFPVVDHDGVRVKLLSGAYRDQKGPIVDQVTGLIYFDVQLQPGAEFNHDFDADLRAFIFVFEGGGRLGEVELPLNALGVLSGGDTVRVRAGDAGMRFILVAGRPIHEPIVQYGPFVMNSQEEIHQAFADYRDGKLVRDRASFQSD